MLEHFWHFPRERERAVKIPIWNGIYLSLALNRYHSLSLSCAAFLYLSRLTPSHELQLHKFFLAVEWQKRIKYKFEIYNSIFNGI